MLESKPQGGGVGVHETLPTLVFAIGGAFVCSILAAVLVIYLTQSKKSELNDNEIVYETETESADRDEWSEI